MCKHSLKVGMLATVAGAALAVTACQSVPERRMAQPASPGTASAHEQQADAMAQSDAERVKARLEAEGSGKQVPPPLSGPDRTGRATVDQPRPPTRR